MGNVTHMDSLAERGGEGGMQSFAKGAVPALERAARAVRRASGIAGLPTGLAALDGLLGGLHASDLVIVAGRPSMGKTALATTIASRIARSYRKRDGEAEQEGGVVGLFSPAMSASQMLERILAEASGLASWRIRKGGWAGTTSACTPRPPSRWNPARSISTPRRPSRSRRRRCGPAASSGASGWIWSWSTTCS